MSNERSIKILIVHNKEPKVHDLFTHQVNSVVEKLSLKIKLQIIWCTYPSDFSIHKPIHHDDDFIDSRKYNTTREIIEDINPDMVIINGSMDFHNVIISFTTKQLGIPLIVFFLRNFDLVKAKNTLESVKSRLRVLFNYDSEIISGSKHSGSREIRKYYVWQISQMFKNLRILNLGFLFTFSFLTRYLIQIFFKYSPLDNVISGDLNFCTNDQWRNRLVSKKFDESKVYVTGDPYFDHLYNEISKNKEPQLKKDQKLKILFCTSTLHEHGLCSKKMEYDLIKDTVEQISRKNNYEISLKIHPSTSSKEDYEENILNKIPYKINLFQKENLVELIKKHDIMLTYGGTGVIHYGVLMKTPVINLDYNIEATKNNIFVDDNVIIQCKNPKVLLNDIEASLQKHTTQEKIDKYVKRYLGIFDGNSAERISNLIYKFIEKSLPYEKA